METILIGQIGLGNPMRGILLLLALCLLLLLGLGFCITSIAASFKSKSLALTSFFLGISLIAISGYKIYSLIPPPKPPPVPRTFNIELSDTKDFSWVPADDRHEYSRWLQDGFCPLSGDITANIFYLGQPFSTETCRNMLVKTKDGALSSVWFDEVGFYDLDTTLDLIKKRKERLGLNENEFNSGIKQLEERINTYNSGDQRTRGAMGRWSQIKFTEDGFEYTIRIHKSFYSSERYALRHLYTPKKSQPVR